MNRCGDCHKPKKIADTERRRDIPSLITWRDVIRAAVKGTNRLLQRRLLSR